VFFARETRLLDPLNEELLNLRNKENAVAAVRATYKFRHGSENQTAEIPTKWFQTPMNAYSVFKGTTDEAALLAWPWSDVNDRLEEVTLTYSLWQDNEWRTVEKHPFVP
jgi:hypothetical protein